MPLSFIRVVICITSSLLFIAESYPIVWMYHSVFIHSLTKGHLGYSQVLAFVNKASVHRFSLDVSFQVIWVNSKGLDYRIAG